MVNRKKCHFKYTNQLVNTIKPSCFLLGHSPDINRNNIIYIHVKKENHTPLTFTQRVMKFGKIFLGLTIY